ncbi:ferredoxin [Mycolicibacterium sp. (ex Dasyatis americana)]|uniref:Oxidoreductase n=1 Tax=Mycobacterium syngnathidarum TaxID=1908205 RepID=A0A1S1KHD0_9MYCO|nr:MULTISPECIES: PDR/VanB family oxidoreductase [Mycobacterium]MCG7606430.1 PDR/VanB family oxidoreductase [Mycobacterium sp. CnD-18-1]OFB38429.1 ferredoxin [Mycolicibacterium sp. (ex Dasyatis americana)]OHU05638.1 oxidoreductase [Mycobacterium syngnathidarum]OLT87848.1 oxidoreductase [Mycobacterium syngnathidarum]
MRTELPADGIDVTVRQLRWEAEGVVSVELQPSGGGLLPSWTAGSHIDLVLPTGIKRQYSLCGPVGERSYYRIGVRRERTSRGGSEYVHAFLRPGQRLMLAGPRNTFELHDATSYLFVAGGIGITPILPMVRQAEARGLDWQLLYGGRTATSMPFLDELRGYGPRVRFHPSDADGRIPLGAHFAKVRPGMKIYACGPQALLTALQDAVAHWPADSLHLERFKPRSRGPSTEDKAVEVVCAASGKTVNVEAGQSILAALDDAGVKVASSCRSGICGACETAVVEGVPDHRDDILSESERATNDRMFICVSRAQTPRLVLDV